MLAGNTRVWKTTNFISWERNVKNKGGGGDKNSNSGISFEIKGEALMNIDIISVFVGPDTMHTVCCPIEWHSPPTSLRLCQ